MCSVNYIHISISCNTFFSSNKTCYHISMIFIFWVSLAVNPCYIFDFVVQIIVVFPIKTTINNPNFYSVSSIISFWIFLWIVSIIEKISMPFNISIISKLIVFSSIYICQISHIRLVISVRIFSIYNFSIISFVASDNRRTIVTSWTTISSITISAAAIIVSTTVVIIGWRCWRSWIIRRTSTTWSTSTTARYKCKQGN